MGGRVGVEGVEGDRPELVSTLVTPTPRDPDPDVAAMRADDVPAMRTPLWLLPADAIDGEEVGAVEGVGGTALAMATPLVLLALLAVGRSSDDTDRADDRGVVVVIGETRPVE